MEKSWLRPCPDDNGKIKDDNDDDDDENDDKSRRNLKKPHT